MSKQSYFTYESGSAVRNAATIVFGVAIWLLGWLMMTLTSSPIAKGAAFLWLPAALQLMAGVWLGPVRGLIAGGLGAYAAGISAYGGWGLPDIIMNPIAGGLANSMLPGLLFAAFKINPDFSIKRKDVFVSFILITVLIAIVIGLAFGLRAFDLGPFGYAPPFLLLLLAPVAFKRLRLSGGDFALGLLICIFASAVSASIGVLGTMVAGQPIKAAIIRNRDRLVPRRHRILRTRPLCAWRLHRKGPRYRNSPRTL
jgi:hypothetical protein